MPLLRWVGLALLVTGVAAIVAGTLWYQHDRTAALAAACKAGLPNFSRPPEIRAEALGCTILGPKRRVRGVLVYGFEEASLHSPNLEAAPEKGGRGGVWYEDSVAKPLDPALARRAKTFESQDSGAAATITVEGWMTLSPDHYGHLGQYSHQFYADRVVAVDPPPRDFWRHQLVEALNQ